MAVLCNVHRWSLGVANNTDELINSKVRGQKIDVNAGVSKANCVYKLHAMSRQFVLIPPAFPIITSFMLRETQLRKWFHPIVVLQPGCREYALDTAAIVLRRLISY